MAPGAYSVEIDGGVGGIQDGPREIVVEAGKTQSLELVLGGGGTISGRVHDAATGEGITGFKMYLYASSGSGFGRELETDALGGYFFPVALAFSLASISAVLDFWSSICWRSWSSL